MKRAELDGYEALSILLSEPVEIRPDRGRAPPRHSALQDERLRSLVHLPETLI